MRLNPADIIQIIGCHRFDRRMRMFAPVQSPRLKGIERMCRHELAQIFEDENIATDWVNAEKGLSRVRGSNCYKRGPDYVCFLRNHLSQKFYGGRLEQSRKWKRLSELLSNLAKEARRENGMPTNFKKVVRG